MKKLFKSKKAFSLTLLSLALIAVIVIGGSAAYFTDQDEVTNVFTMGKIDIGLEEPGWNETDGLGMFPGSVKTKDPTVTAVEGQSYMRIRMELTDANGSPITDANRISLILATLFYDKDFQEDSPNITVGEFYQTQELDALLVSGKVLPEFNADDFIFAGNETGKPGVRYYNYKGIFDADIPSVAVLFTNVVVPADWDNEEVEILQGANGGYKILLTAEAIQSAEMANAAAAFTALNEAYGVSVG